jgi:hypothetical protein
MAVKRKSARLGLERDGYESFLETFSRIIDHSQRLVIQLLALGLLLTGALKIFFYDATPVIKSLFDYMSRLAR